jgi:hypothetical protein
LIEKVIELFEEKCKEQGGVMVDGICYAPRKEVIYEDIFQGRGGKGTPTKRAP